MGGRPIRLRILRCLRGRSNLSFETSLLVCLGRTDEESAGQGGQKKGTERQWRARGSTEGWGQAGVGGVLWQGNRLNFVSAINCFPSIYCESRIMLV